AGAAGRSYRGRACWPGDAEARLSFAWLGDLLEGVLDAELRRLPSPQRRALEVALLLADPVGSAPEPRAVAVAFLAVIRHLSASGPVVLAVDDLQWLDDPSARGLEFALRRPRGEAGGVVGAGPGSGAGGPGAPGG